MRWAGPNPWKMRLPEHARLVTPDVMLHAFHKYFENSLEYLERFDLAPLLRRFLQQAQAKALKYRAQSSGKLAARYEVVAAQLTVPLVILENAQWSRSYEERLKAGWSEQELTDQPDIAETLEGALQGLGKYQKQFSPEVFGRMAQEIRSIYQAAGVGVSPLYGQYAKEGEVKTDYTQFTPRSHYAKTSLLRAYFRAMMYLGRNSYLLGKPEGIADALLLAHLLASPGADGQPLVQDWQKLMEITAFLRRAAGRYRLPGVAQLRGQGPGHGKIFSGRGGQPGGLGQDCPATAGTQRPPDPVRRRRQSRGAGGDQGRNCWPAPRPSAFSASASPSTPGC